MEKFQNLPEKYTESSRNTFFHNPMGHANCIFWRPVTKHSGALEAHIVKVDQFIEYKWSSN